MPPATVEGRDAGVRRVWDGCERDMRWSSQAGAAGENSQGIRGLPSHRSKQRTTDNQKLAFKMEKYYAKKARYQLFKDV